MKAVIDKGTVVHRVGHSVACTYEGKPAIYVFQATLNDGEVAYDYPEAERHQFDKKSK